ncbi:MAG: hypothetical protein FWD97_08000 [Defluviitaleaceae bacterium]|nr:hypothetical protein [Defluviitaleaceae bacterium]
MDETKLNIKPMEQYEAPKIPTLDEIYKNPEPLKKLPTRWAKNVVVVASVGILGLSTLAGCAGRHGVLCNEYGVGYHGIQEFDLVTRIHHGGSGSANYVVHMTEQEVLSIIHRRLEETGLRLCDIPPDYTVDRWFADSNQIGIDLFDQINNVAVSYLGFDASWGGFAFWGHSQANWAEIRFAEQTDITVGTFYTPIVYPNGNGIFGRPTRREREKARPILEERLNQQINEFIELLRDEGIIE